MCVHLVSHFIPCELRVQRPARELPNFPSSAEVGHCQPMWRLSCTLFPSFVMCTSHFTMSGCGLTYAKQICVVCVTPQSSRRSLSCGAALNSHSTPWSCSQCRVMQHTFTMVSTTGSASSTWVSGPPNHQTTICRAMRALRSSRWKKKRSPCGPYFPGTFQTLAVVRKPTTSHRSRKSQTSSQ